MRINLFDNALSKATVKHAVLPILSDARESVSIRTITKTDMTLTLFFHNNLVANFTVCDVAGQYLEQYDNKIEGDDRNILTVLDLEENKEILSGTTFGKGDAKISHISYIRDVSGADILNLYLNNEKIYVCTWENTTPGNYIRAEINYII